MARLTSSRLRKTSIVGDAEWEGEFKDGKHNGSWNVMKDFIEVEIPPG